MIRRIRLPLVLPFLLVQVGRTQTLPSFDSMRTIVRRAATGSAGDAHSFTTGRFSGSGIRDVVYVQGTTAKLATAPIIHCSIVNLPDGGQVNDLATMAGAAASGEDALLLVGGTAGLRKWQYAWSGGVPSAQFQTLDNSSWANARKVRCGWTSFGWWVIGLDATQELLRTGVLSSGNWTGGGSITPPGTVYAMAVCDYDHDGNQDLAALTSGGLAVYCVGGTCIASFPTSVASGATMCCVHSTTFGDALACTLPSGTTSTLFVLRQGQTVAETLSLAFVPAGMAAGDVTADGEDDLLLKLPGDHQLVDVLLNMKAQNLSTFSMSYAGTLSMPAVDGASNLVLSPTLGCADLDSDGDGDVFAVATKSDGSVTNLVVGRSSVISVDPGLMIKHLGFIHNDLGTQFEFSWEPEMEQGNLTMEDFNKLEIIAWRQDPSAMALAGTYYATPVDRLIVDMGGGSASVTLDHMLLSHVDADGAYAVLLRPLRQLSGQPTVIGAPFLCSVFRTATAYTYLQAAGSIGLPFYPGLPGDSPGSEIGGVTPRPDLPPPPPGVPPVVPPPPGP
jgi:hypothetical protein